MSKLQTLKGFRDFLPQEAQKRQHVIEKIRSVFESYGYQPLETPALEYEEVLLGKYGQEGDKLMYRFTDNGGRKVALRYDQTVPTARVVAQYQHQLPNPFKRYQIQNVWRAENTQKGRFREFLQCDADIFGTHSPLADAEVIAVAAKCLKALGFRKFEILVNDRGIFSKLKSLGFVKDSNLNNVLKSLDKLKKIDEEGVISELGKEGFSEESARAILENAKVLNQSERIIKIFELLSKLGVSSDKFVFSSTLARGLDYYTSTIFEVEIDGYSGGSVCGGGRYDKLIGLLGGPDTPAVGFAFGFDRLIDALEEHQLFPKTLSVTQALITIFDSSTANSSIKLVEALRRDGINIELYLGEDGAKLDKQLKYANQKGIPFVAIIGPDEAAKAQVTLKDLATGTQKTIPQTELAQTLNKSLY